MMRITQSMISQNMLKNISNSYSQIDKYMDQLSTGKKINRPSDDPVVAMRGVSHRDSLGKIEQYERNIAEVNNWMDNSDDAMNEAGQALHRVRELIIQASNDTYEENQRNNISKEVDQLKKHLVDIANTKVNNKYIFNGTNTTEARFDKDGQLINAADTNNNDVEIELADGIKVRSNVNPANAFPADLFSKLDEVVAELENPNASNATIEGYIEDIDGFTQSLTNERADLGARMNRVELMESRIAQQRVATTDLMSSNEDADMEKVIMNLVQAESVNRAALGAGSRVIQPTLLDFLR